MAFDEQLAGRVRQFFEERSVSFEEKKMMGGLCFMVEGKMCVGVDMERLMARLDPAVYEMALEKEGASPMDFTGRPMLGFVYVGRDGYGSEEGLGFWLALALDFNPRAKSSKKRVGKKPASGARSK